MEHVETYRDLEGLNAREQVILILRTGVAGTEPLTYDQLGRFLLISRERVAQIEKRAREKLADQPTQTTPKGLEIPVPTREAFDGLVRKVAGGGPAGRKRPDETASPRERSD